jgi:hypothetical protein
MALQGITTEQQAAERERRLGAAFTEGRVASQRRLATGLNPYDLEREPEEHAEWLRGHQAVGALQAAEALAQRARTARCRYVVGQNCNCGARGLCLDVA